MFMDYLFIRLANRIHNIIITVMKYILNTVIAMIPIIIVEHSIHNNILCTTISLSTQNKEDNSEILVSTSW